MLRVEILGKLLFGVMFFTIMAGIGSYLISKLSAVASGAYSPILLILEECESIYDGYLPATTGSRPVLLKDALYPCASPAVDWGEPDTWVPVLRDAKPKINDPSMWYYHCPPSLPGELSRLTLMAPILNERDIQITIKWHRAMTGWNYRIVSEGGKKYVVMTTEALCREVNRNES